LSAKREKKTLARVGPHLISVLRTLGRKRASAFPAM
jgi:hypothetical protein